MRRTACVLPLLLAGCATPELDRFKAVTVSPSAEYEALRRERSRPSVEVYAYTPPNGPEPRPGRARMQSLSDHGQAALIEGAFANPANTGAVKALAASPFDAADNAAGVALNAAALAPIERTLVIDVSKGLDFNPGDRLSWTMIEIAPKNFRFAGYSVAATKFESIDVADIEDTQSVDADASVAPAGKSAAFGLSFGRERSVSSSVEQRYADLSVGIRPELLRVTRESERNRDVSGNTFIELALDYSQLASPASGVEGFLVSDLRLTRDGDPLAPDKASAAFAMVRYPPACRLRADITFAYELRRAGSAGRTFVEGDDRAAYQRDAYTMPNVEIIPASELKPRLWRIVAVENGADYPVELAAPLGFRHDILFANYGDARQFARWMMDRNADFIGKTETRLQLKGRKIPDGAAYPQLAPRLVAEARDEGDNVPRDCRGAAERTSMAVTSR